MIDEIYTALADRRGLSVIFKKMSRNVDCSFIYIFFLYKGRFPRKLKFVKQESTTGCSVNSRKLPHARFCSKTYVKLERELRR